MRKNQQGFSELSKLVRLILALALLMPAPPSAGAETAGNSVPQAASIGDLDQALNELGDAIQAKLADDLDATASALWYVYDIEEALNGNFAAWAYAAWAGLSLWISTPGQIKNLVDIWRQLPRIAASGNWVSLSSYITSIGTVYEAGKGLAFALNGPEYADSIKDMYENAGRTSGEHAFKAAIKDSLQRIVWIRPPKSESKRVICYGGSTLSDILIMRINTVKHRLQSQTSLDLNRVEQAIDSVKSLQNDVTRSRMGSVEIELDNDVKGTEVLAVGAVAELRITHTKARGYRVSTRGKTGTTEPACKPPRRPHFLAQNSPRSSRCA